MRFQPGPSGHFQLGEGPLREPSVAALLATDQCTVSGCGCGVGAKLPRVHAMSRCPHRNEMTSVTLLRDVTRDIMTT